MDRISSNPGAACFCTRQPVNWSERPWRATEATMSFHAALTAAASARPILTACSSVLWVTPATWPFSTTGSPIDSAAAAACCGGGAKRRARRSYAVGGKKRRHIVQGRQFRWQIGGTLRRCRERGQSGAIIEQAAQRRQQVVCRIRNTGNAEFAQDRTWAIRRAAPAAARRGQACLTRVRFVPACGHVLRKTASM